MIALIDGDIIVYSVAGACEGNRWHYKGEIFESKTILNKALKEDGVDETCITHEAVPEPWESCRNSVITYLDGILDYLDCEYEVYLSGKGNFRYQAATIQPYKGNRTNIKKPFHYDNVRQFLVDYYDAKISDGIEADDLIGLNHDPEKSIISTLDKDLNCIPGLHHNWMHKTCTYITDVEADRHFYSQVLTGDRTDNIPGLFGVGEKSKLVSDVHRMSDPKEMFDFVASAYKDRFGSYWRLFMIENCRLLWILQKRKSYWIEYLENQEESL